MRNLVLFLLLFVFLSEAYAESISSSGFAPSYRRQGHYHRYNGFNPFYRNRYGALTGFSPPVNYNINPYYSPYQNYSYSPFVSNNGFSVRRWLNNKFNGGVNFDPYVNGNYTPNNKKYIKFFDNGNANGLGGQVYNGYGLDTVQNSNSGATVTIID